MGREAAGGERLRCVHAACRGEGACDSTQVRGRRARGAERTRNMSFMFVTREVSQPEMSALKLNKLLKRLFMSVTPETHQPAMGPYFAVAAAAFESYSVTAFLRPTLAVKVLRAVQGEVDTHPVVTRANSARTRASSAWRSAITFEQP